MRTGTGAVGANPPVGCQLTLIASRVHRNTHFWCGSRAADPLPWIAVGTQVTLRPPHRSVRAQLRHTAPTLGSDGKANAWPWVKDLGLREEVIGQLCHPLPR